MRPAVLFAAAIFAGRAAAEDGITVQGSGEARAKPDRLEFGFRNNGISEIAGDASVKLRDAQRRTVAALEKLAIPNLKLEAAPLAASYEASANQQVYYNNGMTPPAAVQKLDLARQTKVVVGGIDKLSEEERLSLVAKLLDAARDAGAKFGDLRIQGYNNGMPNSPAGFLRYTLADPSAVKDAASKNAFADAETRAKKLAALAGGTLGPAVDVIDDAAPAGALGAQAPMPEAAEDTSEVVVKVRLKVRFAFKPATK